MSEIEFDTRLVSFREHVESRDDLKDRIAQIELEQAKQRAALMHLPDEVRRLSALIADALGRLSSAQAPPSQTGADHYALSLHRIADMFLKRSGGANPVLMAFALMGAAAAGAVAFFLAMKLG